MTYEIVNSGSDGNAIIVNDILLDVGVPYKKIEPYLNKIKFIFISHRHSDHLKPSTIRKIVLEHPNIRFLVGILLVNPLADLGVKIRNILVLETGKWYELGNIGIKVKLDYLYHDVPNYAIHIEKNNYKMIYATDTSKIDHIVAKDYDFAFIESNYDTDEELEEQIKIAKEKGKFTYLERVKRTHLSQLQAINWLQENNINNYEFIHIHKEKKEE